MSDLIHTQSCNSVMDEGRAINRSYPCSCCLDERKKIEQLEGENNTLNRRMKRLLAIQLIEAMEDIIPTCPACGIMGDLEGHTCRPQPPEDKT